MARLLGWIPYATLRSERLYLSRIEIENIRSFEHVVFELAPHRRVASWSIALGDNGTGKTTLLRSIAIGLSDEAGAASLLGEIYGPWVRDQGAGPGRVTLEIATGRTSRAKRWTVTTEVRREKSGYYSVKKASRPTDFPWEQVFVCGYGAARRAFSTKDYSEYGAPDATYTLFNYDAALQNPELLLRRFGDARRSIRALLQRLDRILQLPDGSIQLSKTGIVVSGPWGRFMPFSGLGDGYQATLAWIVDLVGWAFFFNSDLRWADRDISGIVLVDELDQHLHPRWQLEIIGLLASQFPSIQFIATTHAPLVPIGLTRLKKDEANLFLLRQEEEKVVVDGPGSPPKGLRADQVLTSDLFGLLTTTDNDTTESIERYARLQGLTHRSTNQERELKRLQVTLDRQLGRAETQLQRDVEDAVKRVLHEGAGGLVSPAANYEVRRQIDELFAEATGDPD